MKILRIFVRGGMTVEARVPDDYNLVVAYRTLRADGFLLLRQPETEALIRAEDFSAMLLVPGPNHEGVETKQ